MVVNDACGGVIRVGVDENGLGPRLGPLVVTAVWAHTTGPGHRRAEERPRGALRTRLGDSKKLVAYGDSALGEAWARAVVAHTKPDRGTPHPDALVQSLSLDSCQTLRAPCPQSHAEQCWSTTGEVFEADPGLVGQVSKDLLRLKGHGVDVLGAACIITCARRLNEGADRGHTRFHLDLHAMERLVLYVHSQAARDVVATCGKVGGFNRYPPAFGPMNGRLHAVAEEGAARSEYSLPGLGRIAFVRDADDHHLLVCMASLIGKWVRDLLMARVVRYHRAVDPNLPDASGYHDPITSRFIDATQLARARRGLPDDCFERRPCDKEASKEREN